MTTGASVRSGPSDNRSCCLPRAFYKGTNTSGPPFVWKLENLRLKEWTAVGMLNLLLGVEWRFCGAHALHPKSPEVCWNPTPSDRFPTRP